MKLSALLVTLSSIAAFAQDAAQPEQPGALASFLPLILLFVVMWLFFIRPKQKEMKQMDEMRKQLKKGDKVMTAAGIIGTIASMEENIITLRTGTSTIEFEKAAILRVINNDTSAKVEEKK
ncbi:MULTISPECIES: preprotein translocase subunit YajC [Fibrobacter]|jgi:preprotein translocase subunit YajC|uniref:preprotein translocase subunit YajC n=1 Tax=Fibrobacter TaxID=832 RepID=UPI000B5220ED|nr:MULTISPECIES: preprotein translocase subunit YajC [Fibrobacter]MBQ2561747.1 preprotein translocase subunit YajC [Fibrobacter sp.]MBR2094374.1 preprotein translocase subunit YajC [Fibrobacter sp.]MBR6450947.1 preprotein translocase subunit YajC [Fibrobacter sp.]MBR6854622.1 preprotein translocase subunit YajC [Fibrobacter sp.]MBR6941905.1 preprotein translocase subunit YajC [Fibrobacter sp.]